MTIDRRDCLKLMGTAEHGVAVASAPVREAMSKGRPLIAGFSRVATTEPVSVGA